MNDNRIAWRIVDFWKYELDLTIATAMLLWLMIFFVVSVFAVLANSVLLLYIGFSVAWGVSGLVIALQIYMSKLVPNKVGYDTESIYYNRTSVTKEIPFSDIERLDCSKSRGGYIGVRKLDGTDVWLGPGCGGTYGRNMLEAYRKWIKKELGKDAEIKESKKLYHKIYVVEIHQNDDCM